MVRWTKRVAALALILIITLSGTIAAVITEGALHPIPRRRASDTAALAQSSASAVSGTARQVTLTARRVQRYGHMPKWIAAILVEEALLYARLAYHVSLSQAKPANAVRRRIICKYGLLEQN
jgi:hypothetical protein